MEKITLDTKISELEDVSVRLINVLKSNGVETVRDLLGTDTTEFSHMRNMSMKSKAETEELKERIKNTSGLLEAYQKLVVLKKKVEKLKPEMVDCKKVFAYLQGLAEDTNAGKSEFAMERADGWKWAFVVTAPGYKEDEDDNED